MSKNIYVDSMQKIQFSADFDDKTIAAMEKAARRTKQYPNNASFIGHFKWQYAVISATTCVILGIAIYALPMLWNRVIMPETIIDASVSIATSIPSADVKESDNAVGRESEVPIAAIMVVDAKQYSDMGTDSMRAPKPGEVLFDEEVYSAVNDPATDDMYFFVGLDLVNDIGATELGRFEDYLFDGKTIAEWRVLVDLANGTYPYNEYCGDFGGNVTEAEYEAAIAEAKTLDADANLAAATDEYNGKYEMMYPDPEALRMNALEAECTRLKSLGYDASLYETWAYYGDGQKEYQTILAGLFTKDELLQLRDENANPQAAEVVCWVRNGDGIENWTYAKWDNK